MLPTHLPASCLPRILKDFAALIEKDCEPGTDPLMWLAGCVPEERFGHLPYEVDDDERVLDPDARLDAGEELAIRLHTAFVGEEMTLIDGDPYLPLGTPNYDGNEDEEEEIGEDNEFYDFPTEMSFFALGVKRNADRLQIRPIRIAQCSNPGGNFHRAGVAEFPPTFMNRVASYLDPLRQQ